MKAQKSCKELKSYWINKQRNLFFLLGIIALVSLVYLSFEREREVSAELNKNVVISVNNQVIIDRKLNRDTINITVKKFKTDTVIVKEDTTTRFDTITQVK